ncbi:MAG TPA: DUF2269 family protein [Steroidobacteraceae bacterium]|nr:DUF2269 family protein [Steroidobacteraceae bacterium]
MHYLVLKSLHVLSVVLFLGNIITGVFWKFHADRGGELRGRELAIAGIIRSDRWFTMPGVMVIIVTGLWMAIGAHMSLLRTTWILWGIILFGISGVCFGAFVGPLQKKLLANVRAGIAGGWDQAEYRRLSRRWEIWGGIATLAPVIALFLMVMKPA